MIEPDESDWKTARDFAAVSSWARQDVEALATFIATAKAEERAAVVAWLRRGMQPCSGPVRSTLAWAANGIECGDHRREEER